MNRLCNLLMVAGIGAGVAYFFDPANGRARRARLRDQFASRIRKTGHKADAQLRHLRNRTQGAYHDVRRDAEQVVSAAKEATEPIRDTVRKMTTIAR